MIEVRDKSNPINGRSTLSRSKYFPESWHFMRVIGMVPLILVLWTLGERRMIDDAAVNGWTRKMHHPKNAAAKQDK